MKTSEDRTMKKRTVIIALIVSVVPFACIAANEGTSTVGVKIEGMIGGTDKTGGIVQQKSTKGEMKIRNMRTLRRTASYPRL